MTFTWKLIIWSTHVYMHVLITDGNIGKQMLINIGTLKICSLNSLGQWEWQSMFQDITS